MKRVHCLAIVFWCAVLTMWNGASNGVNAASPFLAQEIVATRQPIRPGVPGARPFWNAYSYQFMYAPAFNLRTLPGAVTYRFTAISEDRRAHVFTADEPWAPLSPIWDDIPKGIVELTVEGLDESRRVLGTAGEVVFYRSPIFNGPYNEPIVGSYADAARRGLRALFLDDRMQSWLKDGKPDPEFVLYGFPSKEMGGAIRGMVAYSGLAESEQEAQDALLIARTIADFLLGLSEPEGRPFEFFPPVYWENPDLRNRSHPQAVKAADRQDRVMTSEPVRAALGYLDLYDVSEDGKYLEAAVGIARTYAKTQTRSGTWPILMNIKTGAVIDPKPMNPTQILMFLDRLRDQYGITEFEDTAKLAFDWLMEHPVEDFHWDAQFEDIQIQVPYKKMAYEQATDMTWYLFANHHADPDKVRIAEELLRWVEDQFVVWEKPTATWDAIGRNTETVGNRSSEFWFTPAVIEQYGFVVVARATSVVMRCYAKAYEATGKEVYRAKARSLANTLVMSQQHHGGGEIPTFPMSTTQTMWINNSVYAALYLLELDQQSGPSNVRITAPRLGDAIGQRLAIRVEAVDTALQTLEIDLDGHLIYQGPTIPADLLLEPSQLEPGRHRLVALATDEDGAPHRFVTEFVVEHLRMDSDLHHRTLEGEVPIRLEVVIAPEALLNASISLVPIRDGTAAIGETLYTGPQPPECLVLDTAPYDDGAYDLVLDTTTVAGVASSQTVRVVFDNWEVLEDPIQPPRQLGWFGVQERLMSVDRSDNWEFVGGEARFPFTDGDRIKRINGAEAYLTWRLHGLRQFTFAVYVRSFDSADLTRAIRVYVATDGHDWVESAYTLQVVEQQASGGWTHVLLEGDVTDGAEDEYIRFALGPGNRESLDVQLGHVRLVGRK